MGSSLKLLLFRRKCCSSVSWVPYKRSLNGEGWFGFFLNLQVVRAGSLRPKNEWRNSTTIPTCLFGPFTSVDFTLQPPPILWPPAQKERLSPNLTSTSSIHFHKQNRISSSYFIIPSNSSEGNFAMKIRIKSWKIPWNSHSQELRPFPGRRRSQGGCQARQLKNAQNMVSFMGNSCRTCFFFLGNLCPTMGDPQIYGEFHW